MELSVKFLEDKGVHHGGMLSFTKLMDLIHGRDLVLRIPGFLPPCHCQAISEKMRRNAAFGRYSMADDVPVQRIGMTLFETEGQSCKLETYFQEALTTSEQLREMCAPWLTPLDLLRLRLEEIWPEGANIRKLSGRKMLPGIARMFEAHAQGGLPPHQDLLERDLPQEKLQDLPHVQLAANIYVEIAPEGGELELWDFAPGTQEAKEYQCGEYDFLDRQKLPPAQVKIRPRIGDLILMRSDNVHAVHPSLGGSRIAMSCFIGYTGLNHPLTYWA